VFHLGGDEAGETPGLRAALERGGIGRTTGDFSRAAVEQVDALDLPPGVDRDELRALLRARGPSTYGVFSDGIVVPHARYPIVVPIADPLLRLCYLDGAAEATHRPATASHKALFLLLSPTVKAHLTLLAVLIGALADGRFAAAVKQQAAAETLLVEAARFNGDDDHR
jgi:PTS system nitrogen regulatory IIA component